MTHLVGSSGGNRSNEIGSLGRSLELGCNLRDAGIVVEGGSEEDVPECISPSGSDSCGTKGKRDEWTVTKRQE